MEQSGEPISVEEGTAMLRDWMESHAEVGILLAVSHGQTVIVSRGTVRLEGDILRLRGASTGLYIWIGKAQFRHGPVPVFGQGYVAGETSPGLHVMTEHDDWLFLSPRFEPVPEELGNGGGLVP